jgi:geranylgeranyl pyrophosphate synthase
MVELFIEKKNKQWQLMDTFHQLLDEKRSLVNRRIDELLSSGFEQSEATELVKYTFRTGGKRLRPILVLLACDSVGGTRTGCGGGNRIRSCGIPDL